MPSEEVIKSNMKDIILSMLDDHTLKVVGTVEREYRNGVTYIKIYPSNVTDPLKVQCGWWVCVIEPQFITKEVHYRRIGQLN